MTKILFLFVLVLLQTLLSGCSLLSATRSAMSEGRSTVAETQATLRMLRQESKPDRRVLVTLVGGHRLNPGSKGAARPVQVCVYLSSEANWIPPADVPEGACTTREKDNSLLASERRVLAPEQLLQLSFLAPGTRETWVVVDADFAERATDYRSLRMAVDNQEVVQVNAWLDTNRVSNANGYRPTNAKP
jgi:type VI secretion system VasD/TssJ family lipoprotein